MDRRSFVRSASRLSGAAIGGASALSMVGCAGFAYLTPIETAGTLRLPVSDVPPEGVLLRVRSLDRPVFLSLVGDGTPVALVVRCTHQGCQPDPVGDRLVCPCHGSEFSRAGDVLQGPAERPLQRFPVTREGEDWVVWMSAGGPG